MRVWFEDSRRVESNVIMHKRSLISNSSQATHIG